MNGKDEAGNFTRRSALTVMVVSAASAGGMGSSVFGATTSNPPRTEVVLTSNGPVRGSIEAGVQSFKGLRYGAPTGGANRFIPPRKPTPWKVVQDALAFGDSAPQGIIPGLHVGEKSPIAELMGHTESEAASEDCLFLNLWTPALNDGRKRPVMVWLHGGAFALGSGSSPIYNGRQLAAQGDVVVVTVNHRLDALGYTQLDKLLGPEYASSGAVGMLDIVAVLEWVRDNAVAFGGDPDNVTIFGESGGGWKVSVILAMPQAKGLFHRAIIQSGPGLKMTPKSTGEILAAALLEELDIPPADARKLLDVPTADLMAAAGRAAARPLPGKDARIGFSAVGFSPVVDGIALPRDPFDPDAPEISADVPIMIGTTANEASQFLLHDPKFGKYSWADVEERLQATFKEQAAPALALYRSRNPSASPTDILVDILTQSGMIGMSTKLAERKLEQKAAKVWLYRLAWGTPALGGLLKSTHALDLPLVFNTTEVVPKLVGPGPDPKAVATQMSMTWIAFARHGDPNNRTIPKWPDYSTVHRDVMFFDVKSHVVKDPDHDMRSFWASGNK
ncbi:carboxylesterase/lipase family protein [Sphingobium sp. SA916]|uniref:carboxylesterase/lipase family protein n=1 Tax=Sphingobium sp. SA916 TaxID=1851207 RepID=UPI000C9FCB55|nr:carboxylesterase/lipase family protein [Sphingobium sp. SA916]